MTLEDAIQHCREKEDCSQCGQEHRQLRKWLEELKRYKENLDRIKPHGDLVDRDEVNEKLKEQLAGDSALWRAKAALFSAKTIIEAEE